MADKKISELTSIQGSATAQNDLFVMVDADTGTTKKISRAELNNAVALDVLDTVDINGGNIDGTIIGAATPAAGTFTALTANSGADVTGNITVSGNVDGRDVAADGTKLDGIESNATADQTGAEIATALNGETITSLTALTMTGALTVGGDLTVNGTTTTINSTTLTVDDKNLELASGAADAAAANGAGITIDGASATFQYASAGDKWAMNKNLDVSGNIAVSGVVDGRDLQTDGAKLDGIETGATADQTAAEIRTLVDSATDSNVFTDADHTKLNGIEASADVTDTANVTAAGALMDSEVSNLAAVKSFNPADYATAAQGTLAANALPKSGGTMTGNIAMSGTETVDGRDVSVDGAKLDGIETGATADQTGAEIKAAYEGESDTNAFTDALLTKLNGIEASATADQTAAEIRTLVESATDSNVFTDADHTKLNGIAANATAVSDLTDLGISDGSNGQVLKTDGAGNFSFGNVGAGGSVAFSSITGLPTTISGYGITDAFDGQTTSLTGGNFSHSGNFQFLNGGAAQNILARSVYAGVSYAAATANAGEMDALNGYRVNGTIAINSSRQFFAEGLIRVGSSSYQIGFGTDGNFSSSSVGHTAANNEGLFWHTSSSYGIYRTAGAWSSPTYQQLKLDWPTGIILGTSARGTYTHSHVEITQACNIGENLQIGTQSVLSGLGQLGLYRSSNPFISWYSGSTSRGAYQQYIGSSDKFFFGEITDLQSAGNVTAYASDERLKKDFAKLENALEKVCSLEGVTYQWDKEKCEKVGFKGTFGKTEIGLRAQQVEKVFPEVVTQAPFDVDEDGKSKSGDDYLTMYYERLTPVLVEAIKEQQAIIDSNQLEILQMKDEIKELKKAVSELKYGTTK